MFSSQKNIDILKRALDAYVQECDDALPIVEAVSFSETFEKNMQKLIKRQKRFYFNLFNTFGKRVACIVLVIFIGLFATVFSVDAFREPFINFVVETYEKFTKIFPAQDLENVTGNFVFEIYEPQYIPDGFIAQEPSVADTGYMCTYIDVDGNYFVFTQVLRSDVSIMVNTEDGTYEKIYIHASEAIYHENKGMRGITYSVGDYTFSVTGYLSKETIIKIAESIKIN